jgi:hypothetical protein
MIYGFKSSWNHTLQTLLTVCPVAFHALTDKVTMDARLCTMFKPIDFKANVGRTNLSDDTRKIKSMD